MRAMPTLSLGEEWMVSFDPLQGHEQGGIRPGLVISNDPFNRTPHTLCVVVPLTRTNRGFPSHVEIHSPQGGLRVVSFALCEQARSLSVSRFRRRLGTVELTTVKRVQAIVGMFIDR